MSSLVNFVVSCVFNKTVHSSGTGTFIVTKICRSGKQKTCVLLLTTALTATMICKQYFRNNKLTLCFSYSCCCLVCRRRRRDFRKMIYLTNWNDILIGLVQMLFFADFTRKWYSLILLLLAEVAKQRIGYNWKICSTIIEFLFQCWCCAILF